MANTYYRYLATSNTADMINELVRFMVNDHATETGPNWTIVDSYSSAAATKHEIPSDAADLDSLAADNSWRTGSLVASDYIVLLSASASNKFQVSFEYQSTTVLRMIIAPLAGFNTSFDNADSINAGNWDNPKQATFDFSTTNAAGNMAVTANADRFILFTNNSGTKRWTYIGKLINTYADDEYSAVHYNNEGIIRSNQVQGTGGNYWKKISMVDDSTELTCGGCALDSSLGDVMSNATDYVTDPDGGKSKMFPISIISNVTGHQGHLGELDGVYSLHRSFGVSDVLHTLNTKAYIYATDSTNYAPVAWEWNGVTAVT